MTGVDMGTGSIAAKRRHSIPARRTSAGDFRLQSGVVGGGASSIEYVRFGKVRDRPVTAADLVRRRARYADSRGICAVVSKRRRYWRGGGRADDQPIEIVENLIRRSLPASPIRSLKARLDDLGGMMLSLISRVTDTESGEIIADETAKWGVVITFANIKSDCRTERSIHSVRSPGGMLAMAGSGRRPCEIVQRPGARRCRPGMAVASGRTPDT